MTECPGPGASLTSKLGSVPHPLSEVGKFLHLVEPQFLRL